MSTHNKHFNDKIGKIPKISPNICCFELPEEFPRDTKTRFQLAIRNESSMFKSLRFSCILQSFKSLNSLKSLNTQADTLYVSSALFLSESVETWIFVPSFKSII